MYGKFRISIGRTGREKEISLIGGGGFQKIGFLHSGMPQPGNPFGEGYNVFHCSRKFLGNVATHAEAKILMFNALKNHPDALDLSEWQINAKGQLIKS